jgi:hypothetical protein
MRGDPDIAIATRHDGAGDVAGAPVQREFVRALEDRHFQADARNSQDRQRCVHGRSGGSRRAKSCIAC